MFSGIVEEVGRLESISKKTGHYELKVKSDKLIKELALGDSVVVDGVCLTLRSKGKDILIFDLLDQTYLNTKFRYLKRGRLNLEPALKLGDRISGHMVTGHIDTITTVKRVEQLGGGKKIYLKLAVKYRNLVVDKGSIALDGVSLTIQELKPELFSVSIIPYTEKWTNLGDLRAGSKVNLEFDIFGKYIDRRTRSGA
jgi:riboflavin synthase